MARIAVEIIATRYCTRRLPAPTPKPQAHKPTALPAGARASHLRMFADRSYLDASQLRRRDARRDLDRLVEIPGLDQVIAAELLFRFRKRSVGRRDLAVPDADGRGGLDRLEVVAPEIMAAALDVSREGE